MKKHGIMYWVEVFNTGNENRADNILLKRICVLTKSGQRYCEEDSFKQTHKMHYKFMYRKYC